MSTLALYELANHHKALELLLESGEIPEEVILSTLEGVNGEFDDKAIAVAHVVLNLESTAAAITEAAAAMKARAERVRRRAESIRHYLLLQLQIVDRKRIDCAEFVIRRAVNPPAVQVIDEGAIPGDYWVRAEPPAPRIDRKALRNALQGGAVVRGAYLESSERLDIKP